MKKQNERTKQWKGVKSCRICVCAIRYIVELPIWLSHSCETPSRSTATAKKKPNEEKRAAYTLYSRKRRNLLCFGCWMRMNELDKRKKNVSSEKNCGIASKFDIWTQTRKKLKNLWNACVFEEPIVYRICAFARKHVNQLSSTRFPNVMRTKKTQYTQRIHSNNDSIKKISSVWHANTAPCTLSLKIFKVRQQQL